MNKKILISFGVLSGIFAVALLRTSHNFGEIPVYRKAMYELPTSLDPLKTFATTENTIANMMYEGLTTVDGSLRIEPQLASDIEAKEGGKHYVFSLRKNAYFHDGSKLKAADVVRSLRRLINNQDGAMIDTYKHIASIEAEGDEIVHIRLHAPYPPFLAILAAPAAKISKPDSRSPFHLGTGPFAYEGSTIRDGIKVLTLKRAATSKEQSIVRMELVELEENKALELAKTGFVHDTSIYTTKRGEAKEGLPIVETFSPSAVTWIFSMNASKGPLTDKRLRRCVDDHFGKEEFVKKFIPEQQVAKGFLPPTLAGSEIKDEREAIDTATCKQAYSDVSISFDYPSVLRNGEAMCQHFSQNMKDAFGLRVNCIGLEFSELVKRLKQKKSEFSFLAMTLDLPDVEYFLNTFESNASLNISAYSSKNIDTLLSQARIEENRIKRADLFSKINHELYENVVTVNVSYPWHVSYRHKCLDGFQVGLSGDAYIDYTKVRLAPLCIFNRGDFTDG